MSVKASIALLVLWTVLVLAALEVYYFQPEYRVLGLLISWFGGLVSFPLLGLTWAALLTALRPESPTE